MKLAFMLLLSLLAADAHAGNWRVQVMAVQSEALALEAEARLEQDGVSPAGIHWRDGIYKVWAGAYETRDAAAEYQNRLTALGYEDAFVIQLGPENISDTPVPPTVAPSPFYVQIFSLTERANADRMAERARAKTGYDVDILPGDGLYRVRLGPFESRDAARFAQQVIQGRGYTDSFLVPADE